MKIRERDNEGECLHVYLDAHKEESVSSMSYTDQ